MELTEESYQKISEYFLKNPKMLKALEFVYKIFPLISAAAYLLMLILTLIIRGVAPFFRMILAPAAAFLTVTVFRKVCNAPRPYEALEITPLFKRDGEGESFPSRHCASAFVISTVAFYLSVWVGIALTAVSLCIAVSRVLSGVHFVRDAAVGSALGILFGIFVFIV